MIVTITNTESSFDVYCDYYEIETEGLIEFCNEDGYVTAIYQIKDGDYITFEEELEEDE